MSTDKVAVIDQDTFEQLKLQCPNISVKIRNAKYKKKHPRGQTLNLFEFLKPKPKKSKHQKRCHATLYHVKKPKRKAYNAKKQLTRLKKCILRHRKLKEIPATSAAAPAEAATAVAGNLSKDFSLDIALNALPASLQALSISQNKSNVALHSGTFRSYCDNLTTDELRSSTDALLRKLNGFQKRAHERNPIKAHAHRRFVLGFREANNFMRINKVKLLIIAPDCENVPGEGGINELIDNLKMQCRSQSVPYLFALKRREIKYSLFSSSLISCVAILDAAGCEDILQQLLQQLEQARFAYAEKHT